MKVTRRSFAPLLRQAGLAVPRSGVANLVFFRVQGDCLAPDIQDGDMLFATWRPRPVCQARLGAGELAVFLIQDAGTGTVHTQLKRWHGMLPVGHVDTEHRVYLLADHVRLAQRGGLCNARLLAGAVYAGDAECCLAQTRAEEVQNVH
jgi:hypothetical protein